MRTVRFRTVFGLAAGALLMLASAWPGSAATAAPADSDAARNQATERLFNAVHANDFSAVQASVGAGADVEAVNRWGITAADLAVDKGYFRIAHYLVSVRNFQRGKTEPATASTGAGVADAAAKSATGRTGAAQPGTSTKPATPVSTPAATTPTSTPTAPTPAATAPAPAPATTTARVAVPARENSAVEDANNPFDPKAPAYGAQVPAVQN
jgi:hypothetical protein